MGVKKPYLPFYFYAPAMSNKFLLKPPKKYIAKATIYGKIIAECTS